MELRQLAPADAEAWRAFRLEALQAHPEAFGADYEDEAARPLDLWAKGLGQTDFLIFGAWSTTEQGGPELAAALALGLGGNAKSAHKAGIYAVYTRPAFRGLGLCSQLLAMALERGRARGKTSFRLSVSEPNPAARRIYERHGFTAYGIEPRALIADGRPVALVMMARDDPT